MSTIVVNRDLAKYIARQVDLTEAEARAVVTALLTYITESLGEGKRVVIRNLGTFIPYTRQERAYSVPGLAEKVYKPADRYVRFRPGRYLLNVLNRGQAT